MIEDGIMLYTVSYSYKEYGLVARKWEFSTIEIFIVLLFLLLLLKNSQNQQSIHVFVGIGPWVGYTRITRRWMGHPVMIMATRVEARRSIRRVTRRVTCWIHNSGKVLVNFRPALKTI
jgi:hypothetical protein